MTRATDVVIGILTQECPLDWDVVTDEPGLIELRSPILEQPHGLLVRLEFGGHVATCLVRFDAFAGHVAAAVREAFEAFVSEGLTKRSTSGWETRVKVQVKDSPDMVGSFVSVDEAGTTVGPFPVHALDSLSAAGYVLAQALLTAAPSPSIEADDTLESGFPEGAATTVQVNRYERDPRNRARAIQAHGLDCKACGVNFGKAYGPLAEGFIHVHHVVPVSQLGADYVIDPVADLVPLCPNCHSAVHRRNPPLTISELRALIETRST